MQNQGSLTPKPITLIFTRRTTRNKKKERSGLASNTRARLTPLTLLHLVAFGVGSITFAQADSNPASTPQTSTTDGVALTITTRAASEEERLKQVLQETAAKSTSFRSPDAARNWLWEMSDRVSFSLKDPVYRVELLELVHKQARAAGLDPQIVLSLIEIESTFNRFAVSKSGARGLMQIMPFWVKEIGHPRDNLFHPETNLWYGCSILRHYLDRSDGDMAKALARYNGGGDKKYVAKVFNALQKRWTLPIESRTN